MRIAPMEKTVAHTFSDDDTTLLPAPAVVAVLAPRIIVVASWVNPAALLPKSPAMLHLRYGWTSGKTPLITTAPAAKANGTYVILVHIGGSERRDQMSNKMLEVAMPHADAYIVYEQANADGYFTKAAGNKPIILLPKTMKMIKTLGELK